MNREKQEQNIFATLNKFEMNGGTGLDKCILKLGIKQKYVVGFTVL
jgi:hypothetical protein